MGGGVVVKPSEMKKTEKKISKYLSNNPEDKRDLTFILVLSYPTEGLFTEYKNGF